MELEVRCPGVQNMHFFLPGTFCEKMKSAWKKRTLFCRALFMKSEKCLERQGGKGYFLPGIFLLPGTFCEKIKSAWKGVEVKDTFLPGTFCEKKKSALKGAEVKNTFLPGTFCEKMKSA